MQKVHLRAKKNLDPIICVLNFVHFFLYQIDHYSRIRVYNEVNIIILFNTKMVTFFPIRGIHAKINNGIEVFSHKNASHNFHCRISRLICSQFKC